MRRLSALAGTVGPVLFFAVGIALLLFGALVLVEPLVVAVPSAVLALWAGGTFLLAGARRALKRRYSTPSA